jgi:predicted lipoprotein with Yx(FWY)xxD motif/plastocyanin
MKKTKIIGAIGLLLITMILFFAGCSGNQPPATTTTTQATTTTTLPSVALLISQTSAGAIITDQQGMSLYTFDSDGIRESNCNVQCAATWMPLMTSASGPSSVPGELLSDIATFTRLDGTTQVAYKGRPLYYYVGDAVAGDIRGDGLGGIWHLAKVLPQPTTTNAATTQIAATTTNAPVTTTTLNPANIGYVKIQVYRYDPQYLTVNVGDTVIWTSQQTTMTVTSPGDAATRELDSPVLGPSQTYAHTFNQIGVYPYYSVTHQQASGAIRVVEKLNIVDSNQATSQGDINSAHGANETGLSNGTYSLNGY